MKIVIFESIRVHGRGLEVYLPFTIGVLPNMELAMKRADFLVDQAKFYLEPVGVYWEVRNDKGDSALAIITGGTSYFHLSLHIVSNDIKIILDAFQSLFEVTFNKEKLSIHLISQKAKRFDFN